MTRSATAPPGRSERLGGLGGHFGAPNKMMIFVEVPAGPFTMGWTSGHPSERPPHVVWLDGFAIATTPVTNAEWSAWLAATCAPPPAVWGAARVAARASAGVGL